MREIDRRDVLVGLFSATTLALTGKGIYEEVTRVPQEKLPIIDVNDPQKFIDESIKLLNLSPYGLSSLNQFRQYQSHIRPFVPFIDPAQAGVVAFYNPSTKDIAVITRKKFELDASLNCALVFLNAKDNSQMTIEGCKDKFLNLVDRYFSKPQPTLFAHEIHHSAQDRFNIHSIRQNAHKNYVLDDVLRVHILTEVAADVAAMRVLYEIIQNAPQYRDDLIANERVNESDDQFLNFESLVNNNPDCLVNGMAAKRLLHDTKSDTRFVVGYRSHAIQGMNLFDTNRTNERVDMSDSEIVRFCYLINKSLGCGEFLTPELFNSLNFNPSQGSGRAPQSTTPSRSP